MTDDPPPTASARSPERAPSGVALLLVLVVVAAIAALVRELAAQRVAAPVEPGSATEAATWIVADPDGLYHARRVERAFEEGLPIAGTDPLLDHPHGAAIPWPPYYDLFLVGLMAPFAPEDAALRRGFVERFAGTVPSWLGVLTSLAVVLAAWKLAQRSGAAGPAAGLADASCAAATLYAKPGVADHHAFVALLVAALFALLTSAFAADGAIARGRRVLPLGLVAGVLAGLLLGSWVASLVHVALVQAAILLRLVLPGRGERAAVARLGLAFHLAALVTLLPAVLWSPWRESSPWIVVNLSWFHPTWLLAGAVVFAAACVARADRERRRFALLTVGAGLALAAGMVAVDAAPWRGVREGLDWASRGDEFMSSIQESRPLLGEQGRDLARLVAFLGPGALLLPFAWLAAAFLAFARKRDAYLVWAIATPVLALQALGQTRFSDLLAVPLTVLLGALAAVLVAALARTRAIHSVLGRARPALVVLFAAAVGLATQADSTAAVVERIAEHGFEVPPARMPRQRAARAAFDWLRERAAERPDLAVGSGVLANWSRGHAIEWAAGLPTVATNFGSYLGTDSWQAPGRFLLAEDPLDAEAVLIERAVRWVFVSSDFPNALPILARASFPDERERWIAHAQGRGFTLTPAFFATMGARLMFDGRVVEGPGRDRADGLGFLRLVRISRVVDPSPKLAAWTPTSPTDWIWERVPGAVIEYAAGEGAELSVEVRVSYPVVGHELVWRASALAGYDGVARVRVPWCTDSAMGDATVTSARWRAAGVEGELHAPETEVSVGGAIRVTP